MENEKDPDLLLAPMTKRGMMSDILVSLAVHLVVIGLTSLSLFADWSKWGVHAPNEIKRLEKAEAKEIAAREKAAAREQAAKAAATKTESAKPEAAQPEAAKKPAQESPAKPPLEREVEKPTQTFDLDALAL